VAIVQPKNTASDRRLRTGYYGNRYATPAKTVAPKVVVAERGDDLTSLASKLNVDITDMQRANPDTTQVQAGAAYSVPKTSGPEPTPMPTLNDFRQADAAMDVQNEKDAYDAMHRINLAPGQTLEQYLQERNSKPDVPPYQKDNWFDAWVYENSHLPPGAPGTPEYALNNPATNFIQKILRFLGVNYGGSGSIDTSGGVGTGAGIGFIPGITQPGTMGTADPYAEPRQRADTTVVSPTDPRANRPADRRAYYGGNIPQPGTDEYYNWLVKNSPYQPGTSEFFAWANDLDASTQMPAGPLSNDYFDDSLSPEEQLRRDWEEIYMNPENKGRGGGIVGWIEERTGLDIDPEAFYTEDRSEEVLNAMLENFRPDELAYLSSHGILVPVESETLPVYGGSGGDYNYPMYYGSGYGGSGPTYKRTPILGLTSWSI